MADEASDTLGGGIRNYLRTIGFSLTLIGLEEFVRSLVSNQPALPHWASFILIATGLPFYVAPWAWDRLQRFFAREEATKSLGGLDIPERKKDRPALPKESGAIR